ncbi:beta-ketoacyl-ACP synthase III [Ferrimicrobium acidiphilum]|jgi:3-oxoacyl-[acyl-carrier-protein] synthase-3|uniref:Beta-ketoacyl-[acyl-carrier-protein] synthase III n=1 Tax=Ferrimicrobium acidiphilum DSM 19497 TaxID=1121877 RepID=A0A0D8FRN1_9ACTN|nr:beta-ketoacyl-ACP synthase III [Ferrimicrobium acidiphilum]KJE75925.1 3-oxoacyl-[acyl-carrier-protein] synthase 3 [Ferrimicrobium acidiphilum DSM 19497]MCL5053683.1 ketoacyl-ACP synthase III [Gammaproteobacteria bacterium]
MGARITGFGAALPERIVTNADFEQYLDTSDEWIASRTGIRERRFGGTTTSLAVEAGRNAIASAGLAPADIDFVVLSTTTPDQTVPATSAEVTYQLGTSGAGMDINAACAGYVYALVTARGLIEMGFHRILVIGADTLSKITDQNDRSTAVLFADGAGAVVLEASDDDTFLGWDLGVDGSARPILYCDHGGYMYMEGQEVFKRAVRAMLDSAQRALKQAGVSGDDVALLVPHQANLRIIQAANDRLGIPMARTAIVLDKTGNTSSGSIPLALADAAAAGRLSRGDLVLFTGFGAGMTWASALVRWELS